jgi:hypothetical protein
MTYTSQLAILGLVLLALGVLALLVGRRLLRGRTDQRPPR